MSDTIPHDLIPHLIELRSSGLEPKLHPHGFLQVPLVESGSLRLHVWDEDVPRTADPDTLHDHVWDFRSDVLVGELLNRVYVPHWDPNGDWQLWRATEERHEGKRGGKVLEPAPEFAYMVVGSEADGHFSVKAGETYSFRALTFHDTIAFGPTATLFEKMMVYKDAEPRILCKRGARPDGDVPAEVSAEWAWEKIMEVVGERV